VKRFGETTAVDHVDLTVPQGSFFGLVGPHGAGKTTSLSTAVGLLRGLDRSRRPPGQG
jgi:ABC-2 type transport system ATP-binding protein